MRIALLASAVILASLAGGCATDNGYGPYYGPSQGYAYPQGYGDGRPYYARPSYGYRAPYGYPYGGAGPGPSITFTIPQG
jgi:hypothetical protein